MIETARQFGPDATLVGVLTQPTAEHRGDIAFLFFNAGVLPRIGPHRLNVKMARALAAAGHTSLRFDLSGQGDSRGGGARADFRRQATTDLQSAMDEVEAACGIRRFVIVGYCSGAVNAYAAALEDERVCGVLMFDGYWFRARWTVPVRSWKRFRAASWSGVARAIAKRIGRFRPFAVATPAAQALGALDNEGSHSNPTRQQFVQDIDALVARGVTVHFVYSGSVIEAYSYRDQFRHAFGHEAFFDKVRCAYRPDIDHTFVTLDGQRRMIQLVLDWLPAVQGTSDSAR